jgi:hypothetical protein
MFFPVAPISAQHCQYLVLSCDELLQSTMKIVPYNVPLRHGLCMNHSLKLQPQLEQVSVVAQMEVYTKWVHVYASQ